MFDARDLLGRLMQSDVTKTVKDRLGEALGSQGQAGSLSEMFSNLSSQAGKINMGDLGRTADSVIGRTKEAVKAGDPLAIGGIAAAAGALLGGGGGKSVRGALGAGLLGVLGSIAWKALKGQQGAAEAAGTPPPALEQPSVVPPSPSAPTVEADAAATPAPATADAAERDLALLMIRAMISAAKADGEIDERERARILGKLETDGASDAERAFVTTEMEAPLDIDALAGAAKTPAVAVQVYSASLLAIEADTPAEVDYLQRLAAALGLDAATVGSVHATLGVPATTSS